MHRSFSRPSRRLTRSLDHKPAQSVHLLVTIVPMTTVQWSEDLALGVEAMDATHQEFVVLLEQAALADDTALLPAWDKVVQHTQEHFGLEDQWMKDSGFSSCECHSGEHTAILAVMQEGGRRGAAGNTDLLRQLARELGIWFAGHAQGMDTALAEHLKDTQFLAGPGKVAASLLND